MNLWPFSHKEEPPVRTAPAPSPEAMQALEDSQLIRETADLRWRRVDAAVERAESAAALIRSQRDQNHLREIVTKALHGDRYGRHA